jgi:gliding motility-associated-like protein
MKMIQRLLFAVLLLSISLTTARAQFQVNGAAQQMDSLCYRLTPDEFNVSGSIWNTTMIDLSQSFTIEVDAFLGCVHIPGADGIVFGFQSISTSVGSTGEGMGFGGIQPSIGIEFDTYPNNELNDIGNDHVAIFRDGDNNHNTSNTLAGPVQCDPSNANIEDCQYHSVLVEWNANNHILEVYWDCDLRLTLQYDIVEEIFDGDPMVFWGFTAATGGEANEHRVCIKYSSLLEPTPDQALCLGQSATLIAPALGADSYTWTPTTGLSSTNTAVTTASPAVTTTYFVTCQLGCSNVIKDTILVEVAALDAQMNIDSLSICPGDDVTLATNAGSTVNFLWSTGATSPMINVTESGVYSVAMNDAGCFGLDTAQIFVLPPPNTVLGVDTVYCEGDSLILTVPFAIDVSWLWSDGSTGSEILVTEPGIFDILLTSLTNSCSTTDEIEVTEQLSPIIDWPNASPCLGDDYILDAFNDGATYFWNDSTTESSLSVTTPGLYEVTVTVNGCTSTASTDLAFISSPVVNFPEDTTICSDGGILLSVVGEDLTILWQNGTTNPTLLANVPGQYGVYAQNNCGEITENVIILVEDCRRINIPNVFSPNLDGVNDGFAPGFGTNILLINRMRIYDRWGGLLFENTNFMPGQPSEEFDGNFRGVDLPTGVYAYEIIVTFRDGFVGSFYGDITLVR